MVFRKRVKMWNNWSYKSKGEYLGVIVGVILLAIYLFSSGYCPTIGGSPSRECRALMIVSVISLYPSIALTIFLINVWEGFFFLYIINPLIQYALIGYLIGWVYGKIKKE